MNGDFRVAQCLVAALDGFNALVLAWAQQPVVILPRHVQHKLVRHLPTNRNTDMTLGV